MTLVDTWIPFKAAVTRSARSHAKPKKTPNIHHTKKKPKKKEEIKEGKKRRKIKKEAGGGGGGGGVYERSPE